MLYGAMHRHIYIYVTTHVYFTHKMGQNKNYVMAGPLRIETLFG
jgi:hypothetical protein